MIWALSIHNDVIKWKLFPRYWSYVSGIHRPLVNSPHNGQWRGVLMFTLICAWISGWVNNRGAGDLRRYRAHYDVTVMRYHLITKHNPKFYFLWWTETCSTMINTLKPRQNGRHFPDHIFISMFIKENTWISIKNSRKFVPKGTINNFPAMVQIMAWRRPGDKPLPEAMIASLPTFGSPGLSEFNKQLITNWPNTLSKPIAKYIHDIIISKCTIVTLVFI